MSYLKPNDHDAVFTAETGRLGETLWFLLKAIQTLEVQRKQSTELDDKVGRDEIHWWIVEKENDIDLFRTRTELGLAAADVLKQASKELEDKLRPTAYDQLLGALRDFAETHATEIQQLHDYVKWLHERDVLAPSILFSYRVWGSTRRGDRWIHVAADTPAAESRDVMRTLIEVALGLRTDKLSAFDRAVFEVGSDMYERDPEGTSETGIPIREVVREAGHRVLDEFVVFFEWIRNSLRQILGDIEKSLKQRNILHNDGFWRDFVRAAVKSTKLETQLWDFKETLSIWRAPQGEARERAKTTVAEDVASLANAQGGVLIIGVTDQRKVVGLGSGQELESRLKFARDVLADRLDYPRDILHFQQVAIPDDSGVDRPCLVIAVARTFEPVGVKDGKGQFTYPVRRETGITRENPRDLHSAKMFFKSDSFGFIDKLVDVVRAAK